MQAVNFPWQLMSGTVKIKCVTVLKNGTYLGLGEDSKQYTRTSPIADWVPVGDGDTFNWVSLLRDGGVLYVGLDGCMYTRATPTSPYTLIGGSGTIRAAGQMRNGTIVAVGMDNMLYTRPYLQGEWAQVPNSGTMIGVTILADDTIVGIGSDNSCYVWRALSGGWSKVNNSGSVLSIAELPDGSLLGVGTNGTLNKVTRQIVGAQYPGFVPLDCESDYRFRVHPAPAFWKFDQNEQKYSDDAIGAVYPLRGCDPFMAMRSYKQRWNDAAVNYSFASMAEYKAAWGALISSLIGKPFAPAYDPVCVLGSACFEEVPGHAAFFKFNAQDWTEKHARMFASTNLYRGPGRYSFLCANLQVINVTIHADPLVNKTYKIVCRGSGLVLTVRGNNAENDAALVQAPDTGALGQRWYVRVQVGVGNVIASQLAERVIDVPGSSTTAGTALHLWEYVGARNQCWKIIDLGGNNVKIVSVINDMALDVPAASNAADTQIVQWVQQDKINQQFTLVAV